MEYIAYFVVIAVTFGCCFLVDKLLQRRKNRKPRVNRVRPARRSVLFGIVICFLALAFGIYFGSKSWLILAGAAVCLLLGVWLILLYGCTGIYYDEQGFTQRALFRRAKHYRYGQITGERAVVARSGVNAALLLGGEEVYLYESMEGVRDFLQTAYDGWLRQRGLCAQDYPPPNPTYLVWFPEETDGA